MTTNTFINNTFGNDTASTIETTNRNETIALVRHLLPISATVGFLLHLVLGGIPFFSAMATLLIIVGFLSALTLCPLQLLKLPFTCAGKGFKLISGFFRFGWASFAGVIAGGFVGFIIGIFIAILFPAVFTIAKWVTRYDYED